MRPYTFLSPLFLVNYFVLVFLLICKARNPISFNCSIVLNRPSWFHVRIIFKCYKRNLFFPIQSPNLFHILVTRKHQIKSLCFQQFTGVFSFFAIWIETFKQSHGSLYHFNLFLLLFKLVKKAAPLICSCTITIKGHFSGGGCCFKRKNSWKKKTS